MKLIILQENISKAAGDAARFIASKPQLPILAGISIEAIEEGIVLRTTDLKAGFSTKVGGKIEERGKVVVIGKTCVDFINTLRPGPVTLETLGDTLLVSQSKTKGTFQTFPPEDFPPFPEVPSTLASISKEVLLSLLENVSYASGLDETRPVLTSLLLEMEEQTIRLVCTDGYRLHIASGQLDERIKGQRRCMVSARALHEYIRSTTKESAAKVAFGVSDELLQASFKVGDSTFLLRLIEGSFPPYEAIVPQSFLFETIIDRISWLSGLKSTLVFARDSSSIVTFTFIKGQCVMQATSTGVGDNESVVETDYQGDQEFSISFNAKFIVEALTHYQSQSVVFKMNETLKPAVLAMDGNDDSYCVVMPFKR